MSSVRDKMEGATGRLTEYVDGGAGPGLIAAVTGAKDAAEGKGPVRSMLGAGFKGASEKVKGLFGKDGKGGGGKGKKLKVTNIVESIDVGFPSSWPTTSGPSSPTSRASPRRSRTSSRPRTKSCTGRRRCCGPTGSGTPTSSSRYPTSGSSGSPRAPRAMWTAR